MGDGKEERGREEMEREVRGREERENERDGKEREGENVLPHLEEAVAAYVNEHSFHSRCSQCQP